MANIISNCTDELLDYYHQTYNVLEVVASDSEHVLHPHSVVTDNPEERGETPLTISLSNKLLRTTSKKEIQNF